MARSRNAEIARKAAKLVVLINALPTPADPRDRAFLEAAKTLVAQIEDETQQAAEEKRDVSTNWFGWVEMLAKIMMDFLMRR